MDKESLIKQIEKIIKEVTENSESSEIIDTNWYLTKQVLLQYAGEKSEFYNSIARLPEQKLFAEERLYHIKTILSSFLNYLKTGLNDGISIEKRTEIDTISRILDQVGYLIEDKSIHPAVIFIVIGAALEDFLYGWVKTIGRIGEIKGNGSIDKYKSLLYDNGYITKSEMKDIESIAVKRNDAAHGKWELSENRKMAELEYKSVKEFIREKSKYDSFLRNNHGNDNKTTD